MLLGGFSDVGCLGRYALLIWCFTHIVSEEQMGTAAAAASAPNRNNCNNFLL